MKIVQIVPYLPPSVSGVGDYAFLLARRLRDYYDIETTFLVTDPNWSGIGTMDRSTSIESFTVLELKERSDKGLVRLLSQESLAQVALLHYAGYGYAKRGCPVWLLRGLTLWKQEAQRGRANIYGSSERHLLTMFHELYATGLPWRSSFWTSPLQKWVTRSLARLSNRWFTNTKSYAKALWKMNQYSGLSNRILPVFSNVGEPEYLPDWTKRAPEMIVFGSASWREAVYAQHRVGLEQACHALGINKVIDIGPLLHAEPHLSVLRVARGALPPEEVTTEMLTAKAGFFAYPVPFLGKSGIFAAYSAHGLVPLTSSSNTLENQDGIKLGHHFLCPLRLRHSSPEELASVSNKAHKWYYEHSLERQASSYSRVLHSMIGDDDQTHT